MQIETRGEFLDGSFSEWLSLELLWQEGRLRVHGSEFDGPVISAKIRVPRAGVEALRFVDWTLTNPDVLTESQNENLLEIRDHQHRLGLSDFLSELGVQGREEWGAQSPGNCSWDASKYRVAIHHTVTPPDSNGNYAARVRQIQSYHMNANGWCDVGYHFLVTQDGSLWEGRPLDYLGAHVGSNNGGNAGISLVGCFEPGSCDPSTYGPNEPPDVALDAIGELVGALRDHFDFEINEDTVKGHRDHAGASTSCPGDNLHSRLGDIRGIAALGGSGGGSSSTQSGGGATVQGVVYDLSMTSLPSDAGNIRLDFAVVEVSGGESRAARSSDAYWAFDLSPGTYQVTASAAGYEAGSRMVTLVAGDALWASIGLMPLLECDTSTPVVDGVDAGDDEQSDAQIEEPACVTSVELDNTDAGVSERPEREEPAEEEGCSQTGLPDSLRVLLMCLWWLRRRPSSRR